MTATNNANSLHPFWMVRLNHLKISQQGGCVKGSLLHTNKEIEMLLQLMEQSLPVGTQEIGYILTPNLLPLT